MMADLKAMLNDPDFLALPEQEQNRLVVGFLKSHEPQIKNPELVAHTLMAQYREFPRKEPPESTVSEVLEESWDTVADFIEDFPAMNFFFLVATILLVVFALPAWRWLNKRTP